MVRDKRASASALAQLARALRPACAASGTKLIINDRCDVSRAVGADGVHLPERGLSLQDARRALGPDALIGASRHGPPRERDAGLDWVTLGPIATCEGKGEPLDRARFASLADRYAPAVYALGGVDESNAASVIEDGAEGVALIRAVLAAKDPAVALARLLRVVESARSSRRLASKG